MCVTFGPSRMSSTIVYAGEALRDGRLVHVLGYQNKAENQAQGPNAMILPIPSAAPLGKANAIDTTCFKNVLKDMATAVKRPSRTLGLSDSFGSRGMKSMRSAERFDVGSYTVVVGDDAYAVHRVLQEVPEAKRPQINETLLAAYARMYPEWSIAVCCFDGTVAGTEPLLWWYEPKDPSRLFAPGLDAHDGKVPNVNARVVRDHTVIFGSTFHPSGRTVRYRDELPDDVAALFPLKAVGDEFYGVAGVQLNGDWYRSVSTLGLDGRVQTIAPNV